MTTDVIISADSHVMEPADLWTSRLPSSLREHAPEVRKNPDRPGWQFHAPGLPPSEPHALASRAAVVLKARVTRRRGTREPDASRPPSKASSAARALPIASGQSHSGRVLSFLGAGSGEAPPPAASESSASSRAIRSSPSIA